MSKASARNPAEDPEADPGAPTSVAATMGARSDEVGAPVAVAAGEGDLGVGRVLAERYRLESVLGRGGFGGVYRAHDLRLDLPVAIKLIPGTSSADRRVRSALEREARLVIRMNHPNVVRFYNFEHVEGMSFIVMELVPGENLHRFRRRVGRFSEAEAATIACRCLDALEYAHGMRVVHRDVKPSNILLAPAAGERLVVKMVDFGIARQIAEDANGLEPTTSSGTPVYMSPEQLRGSFDHRSDLYALGVTLYEMLAGSPPFHGGGLESIIHRILEERPAPIPGISPRLAAILERALRKDPADRFQSAAEFRRALAALTVSEVPVVAGSRASSPPAHSRSVEPGTERKAPPAPEASGSAGGLGTVLAACAVFVLGFGLTFGAPLLLEGLSASADRPVPEPRVAPLASPPRTPIAAPAPPPASAPRVDPEPAPRMAVAAPAEPSPPEPVADDRVAAAIAGAIERGDAALRAGRLGIADEAYREAVALGGGERASARVRGLADAREILELERRGRLDLARIRWRVLLEREVEGPLEVLGARGLARLNGRRGPTLAESFRQVELQSRDADFDAEIRAWERFLGEHRDASGPEVEEARARLGELRIKRDRLRGGR